MMKQLYSEDDVKKLGDKIRKYAVIDIELVILALGVGITICFFVTDSNAKILEAANILFSSVCGCTALYFLLNTILPAREKKLYISRMRRASAKTVRGRVFGKGKKITLVKHLNFSEFRFTDEKGNERILYWDTDNGEPDFGNRIVVFQLVNNKIVGYGDAE